MSQPSVPTLSIPEDITAEVLTNMLQRFALGTRVASVGVHRTHQGTATHVHLDVEFAANPAGIPSRLFVKTQLTTVNDLADHADTLSEGGAGTCLLRDETVFYRQVRPSLDVETLQVYAAELVPGPSQFVIVAENLVERGARFPNVAVPLAVDDVAGLMRTLAQLHAHSWQSPRLTTELNWVQQPLVGEFYDHLRAGAFDKINLMLDTPYKTELLQRFGITKAHLEDAFWRLQERVQEPPVTLLHGDTHPGNIYLLPNGSVGLLDWQLLRIGSWSHDVSYGMIAALTPDDRRANERDLLALYLAELGRHGVESPPSREEAWYLHRCAPPWGFAMWAITPEQMYSVEGVGGVMERFGEAWVDLDTDGALGF